MFSCQKCGIKSKHLFERNFIIPGGILVSSRYYLCNQHRKLLYSFNDIYNEDGTMKQKEEKKEVIANDNAIKTQVPGITTKKEKREKPKELKDQELFFRANNR